MRFSARIRKPQRSASSVSSFSEKILPRSDAEPGESRANHSLSDFVEALFACRSGFRGDTHIRQGVKNHCDRLEPSVVPRRPLECLLPEEIAASAVQNGEQDAICETTSECPRVTLRLAFGALQHSQVLLKIALIERAQDVHDVSLQLREYVKPTRRAPSALSRNDRPRDHVGQLLLRYGRWRADPHALRTFGEVPLCFDKESRSRTIESDPLHCSLEQRRERQNAHVRLPVLDREHARRSSVHDVRDVVRDLHQALPTTSCKLLGAQKLLESSRDFARRAHSARGDLEADMSAFCLVPGAALARAHTALHGIDRIRLQLLDGNGPLVPRVSSFGLLVLDRDHVGRSIALDPPCAMEPV
ncbi:MAG TPA: hypothetical protein VHC69_29150 [Polyangiaceae bacterium]|nr:hypothetical protein [Polyangiaceae bacterium]